MSQNDNIYYGRGTAEMFDEYMDFINYVFGFNGNTNDFKKLLPKLYKYEYEPAVSSYVAVENNKIKAAVGAFDHDVSVCGKYIKTRGIGNVAVHPYTRGKGYMKKLMNMALDDMVSDGVDMSVLGGRRQRYNYFSYDKLGQAVSLSFNDDNIRHTFGNNRTHSISFKIVNADDREALEMIKKLAESQNFYAIRDIGKYFEILSSWKQKAAVAFDNGNFVGYCVFKGNDVNELLVTDKTIVAEFVCALYDFLGGSSMLLKLPAFLPEYINSLIGICEYYDVGPSKSFSVFNYKNVIQAFMLLKNTYTDLPNGSIVLDILGKAKREKICIDVSDGSIIVSETNAEADLKLSHLEAMNLLFAPVCIARDSLPWYAKIWFPLPIYLYSSDAV